MWNLAPEARYDLRSAEAFARFLRDSDVRLVRASPGSPVCLAAVGAAGCIDRHQLKLKAGLKHVNGLFLQTVATEAQKTQPI